MLYFCYTNLRMQKIAQKLALFLILPGMLLSPLLAAAQTDFNPHFIISDTELQDLGTWTRDDVQKFLDSRGSYLRQYQAPDANGIPQLAADIIYAAAKNYQINPKFLLVTLQKEQSLITDDTPTQRQLDWATGYAVCDGCNLNNPNVVKHKGFGAQVDGAAGIMRWYYDNKDKSFVKKKDTPIRIDNEEVTPQSWATAFLYTYTPHLHGNRNFRRIWNTWFEQIYPDGSLLKTADSDEVWLIQNGQRRKFKTKTALITRADPKLAIIVPEIELNNYATGTEISFPNYSLLHVPNKTYLLDYDTLRPFASEDLVGKFGYNPEEIVEVAEADLNGYLIGSLITASTTAPQGIIYQITDLNNAFYLLKDNVLTPIVDKRVIEVNYKNLTIEKHRRQELANYEVADLPVKFNDGTLLRIKDNNTVYVIEKGKKRRVADDDTFLALGYKRSNVNAVDLLTALNIPDGEPLFLNSDLLSAKNKFLGDSEAQVSDLFQTRLPAYLVAEYPSGRIISGKNIDERRPMASLTKLLTSYEAVMENFKPNKNLLYNSKKHGTDSSVAALKNGESIKNSDLLGASLVGSVNAAAKMLAEASGLQESEFVSNINQRLEKWGADNTTIADVTGLDENNKSTPRDLLKIFTKVLANQSLKTTLGKSSYSFQGTLKKKIIAHRVANTNKLLTSKNKYQIIASKTGYTDEAGATLIMLVKTKPPGASSVQHLPRTLKLDSSGDAVKLAQGWLKSFGFFDADFKPNGKFGPLTVNAVKKFQSANGLPSAGYIGPATWTALSKADDKYYIIITMGDNDYAKRFVEPNKIAEWITTGKIKIAADI